MIYKHYKGGLYLMVGYATRLTRNENEKLELLEVAKHTETEESISVYIAYDKRTGGGHYVFDSCNHYGILCFYRDLEGNHWLRPKEMFFEMVEVDSWEEEVPRFMKVTGEDLFNAIGSLLEQEMESVINMFENKLM